MPKVIKYPKMDRNFVSDEWWEIEYIASKFNVTKALVKGIKKKVGISRKKIYKEIHFYIELREQIA